MKDDPDVKTAGCQRTERVAEYALRSMPASETGAFETHLDECAECRRELASLRPVLDTFADWPTDILRPPTSLLPRLEQRIAADADGASSATSEADWPDEPGWQEAAPGVSYKLLATGSGAERVSMLVRLAPGAAYPPHRHAGVEELVLLDGELWIDDRKLRPGDYNRGEPDAVDSRVWSETGCTCLLVTSLGDLLG